jgi:pilus assembly protein Flp/PilA
MKYLYEKARAIRATRDQGASAVEYGLLVAGIAAIIVLAVFTLGGVVNGAFSDTKTSICTDGTTAPTGC